MRYIDDLLTLNNSWCACKLKKTTECPTTLSYLDLLITIDHRKYSTLVFDNRDSCRFNFVNFPHMSSNIPSKPAYGVYISQLVRIGRICSGFVQFRDRHYKLTEKLIAQGCVALKKFSRSHASVFTEYKCSVRKHIEEGICLQAHL